MWSELLFQTVKSEIRTKERVIVSRERKIVSFLKQLRIFWTLVLVCGFFGIRWMENLPHHLDFLPIVSFLVGLVLLFANQFVVVRLAEGKFPEGESSRIPMEHSARRRALSVLKIARWVIFVPAVLLSVGSVILIALLPNDETIKMTIPFVSSLICFGIALLLQITIQLLVRDPSGRNWKTQPEEFFQWPVQPSMDSIYTDWLGSNALKRSLLVLAVFTVGGLLSKGGSSILLSPYLWSVSFLCLYFTVFYKYSLVRFTQSGIEFESAGYTTWGVGRRQVVEYGEASVRFPGSYFGLGFSIRRDGKFVWFLNERYWNHYGDLCLEIEKRFPAQRIDSPANFLD